MYKADIQRQFRDVRTGEPKVLLTNILSELGEFRDHCWVIITKEIEHLIPRKCGIKRPIQFNATPKVYYSGKSTLSNIKVVA